ARVLAAMRRPGIGFHPAELSAGALALARRDTLGAIRILSMPDSVCLTLCPFVRFHLARLLSATRQDSAAAEIYEQNYTNIGIGKIMWMLDRGHVNERLGNTRRAIDSYAYVASAWQRADPELKPYVDDARRGLSALRSDPGRR
ncbi:MAG: hypothetical protein ACREOG_19750, partial [Gemmatimonadaceae bacterium]